MSDIGGKGHSRPAAQGSVGIQSIEVGVPLLTILANAPGPMALSALAKRADMSPSKAHKYLTSFVRCGFVDQTEGGRYDLGRTALELGFAALRRMNIVKLAAPSMAELRDLFGETIVLTLWSMAGAVVVAVLECDREIGITVRIGAQLPLLESSNGQIFAAFMGEHERHAALAREGDNGRRKAPIEIDRLLARVRQRGLAINQDQILPGIVGISAPVFGLNGIVAALTVVAVAGQLDTGESNNALRALSRKAARLTRLLNGEADTALSVGWRGWNDADPNA